jgi:peptidyl-tRNA hydrolase, PTH1 family
VLNWLRRKPDTAETTAAGIALVVGLGNPESRYTRTRHNIGFLAVERLAHRHGFPIKHRQRRSLTGDWRSPAGRVVVAEPQTFMNLSGEAVAGLLGFYQFRPDQALIICDDTSLPFGRIRIRREGSEAGHNGLRSISQSIGTREYARLRIGIGRPPEGWKMIDYVLGQFPPAEWDELPAILDRVCDAVETAVTEGIGTAMNRFNGPAG